MIVLDYPKKSYDMHLIVPPFHTGHLGFIPGTPVSVGLMAPFVSGPTSCELVISPYTQSAENMAVLSCTLDDDIGVVGRLLNAISALNVNIVTQESTVLNHLRHHFVNLLLDLSTSHLRPSSTYESVIRHYREYDSLFPVHDYRYVQIFESVMARCAEVISWREISGKHLPQLQIRPLSGRQFKRVENVQVERHEHARYHVKIPVPDAIKPLLRQYVGVADGQPLSYLLVSDTDERALRAFFPTSDVAEKFIHLGFYHNDVPGALSALLRVLARARFNIVASLLRKHEAARNVWEAVLEYRGDEVLPTEESSGKKLCEWVASRLAAAADNSPELRRCSIDVGLPLYPQFKTGWQGRISLNKHPGLADTGRLPHENINELLTKRSEVISQLDIDPDQKSRMSDLVSAIQHRINISAAPALFISYPEGATRHATLIKERLRERYQIEDYMTPDGEIILEEVVRKIIYCTYFIGVWHHDERLPTEGGKYNISPWLPFEYGVALAAKKHAIVIHSEKLDERVWKRINPGVGNPEYSDIQFTKVLDTVDAYCRKHMK